MLNTQTVSSFHSGVYLDYAVSGNILITITKTAGSNAVLNGLFFDPATTSNAVIGGIGSATGGITSTPAYGAIDLVDPTSGPKVGRRAATVPTSPSKDLPGAGGGSAAALQVAAIDLALEALPANTETPSPAQSLSNHDAALEQVLEAEQGSRISRHWVTGGNPSSF